MHPKLYTPPRCQSPYETGTQPADTRRLRRPGAPLLQPFLRYGVALSAGGARSRSDSNPRRPGCSRRLLRAGVSPAHTDRLEPGRGPLYVRVLLHDGDGVPHGLRMGCALPGSPRLPGADSAAGAPVDAFPGESRGARHFPEYLPAGRQLLQRADVARRGWRRGLPGHPVGPRHGRPGQRAFRRAGGRRAARRADHLPARMAVSPRLRHRADAAHGAAGDEPVPDTDAGFPHTMGGHTSHKLVVLVPGLLVLRLLRTPAPGHAQYAAARPGRIRHAGARLRRVACSC